MHYVLYYIEVEYNAAKSDSFGFCFHEDIDGTNKWGLSGLAASVGVPRRALQTRPRTTAPLQFWCVFRAARSHHITRTTG